MTGGPPAPPVRHLFSSVFLRKPAGSRAGTRSWCLCSLGLSLPTNPRGRAAEETPCLSGGVFQIASPAPEEGVMGVGEAPGRNSARQKAELTNDF